ncbi:MAG: hypothetical protein R3D03_11265 [Geminicoccaceae bacterium]
MAAAGRIIAPRLELIAINGFPGIEPFFGLGQLSPEHLRRLWREQRRPVTPTMLERGRKVDAALCSPAADALQREADTNTPELPLMAPALRRYLRTAGRGHGTWPHPATDTGTAMHGPRTAGRLFKRLHDEAEPMPFLGDLMYWPVLHELAAASCLLIDVAGPCGASLQRAVAITETAGPSSQASGPMASCAPLSAASAVSGSNPARRAAGTLNSPVRYRPDRVPARHA